jgi:hypothetical protein
VGTFGAATTTPAPNMAAAMTAMVRPQGLRSVPPVKLRLKVPPAHESERDWTLFY